MATATDLSPNIDAVREFLIALHDGPWSLFAGPPDRKGTTQAWTFDEIDEAVEFACDCNERGYNVYFSVNKPRAGVNKKASKAEIERIDFLHVDCDPDPDETSEAFKARKLPEFEQHNPELTFIIDSGNGVQGLWRLTSPGILVTGSEVIAVTESRNIALAISLDAPPGCHNVDRVLRLPGSINWPDAHKRSLGRVPVMARLLRVTDAVHDPKTFATAARAAKPKGPGKKRQPGEQDESGSGFGFRFMIECHRDGLTFEDACYRIRADNGRAGEWARRVDERQIERAWSRSQHVAQLNDFYAHLPSHEYLYVPTRELWKAGSVNAVVPWVTPPRGGDKIPASLYLDRYQAVQQMTWSPGEPMLIEDRLIADGGWVEYPGRRAFNTYRPPEPLEGGDATKAGPWVELVRKVYPTEADEIFDWFACRVQRPDVKINHALVLGGAPGIGKDSILKPLKGAVGSWNFLETTPKEVLERPFNMFLRSIILRISEARDLGEYNRFAFYDRTKIMIAEPPEVLRVEDKNVKAHYIRNLVGILLTSNHKLNGLYLAEDDRRHLVAWSDLQPTDFEAGYWKKWHTWHDREGCAHIVAWLQERDLSGFNPKAPPRKTPAFWLMVDTGRSPESANIADAIDELGNPGAFILAELSRHGDQELQELFEDKKRRTQIPYLIGSCGYSAFRNEGAKDGLWSINRKRVVVYVRDTLSNVEKHRISRDLVKRLENEFFPHGWDKDEDSD
jgi:hypothetical protein